MQTETRPAISYLVCGTPRSGSSLLCEALKNTGIAGNAEEYFWSGVEPHYYELWNVTSYEEYVRAAIRHGTTPNGVFGAKIMRHYLDDFTAKLGAVPGYEGLAVPAMFEWAFPNLHYIWIRRRDKLSQAVSFWKANQTDVWAWDGYDSPESPPAMGEPVFDAAAIGRIERELTEQDEGWAAWFPENAIEPFTVVYEEFVPQYEQTALAMLEFLGIPAPEGLTFKQRRLQKQADALNEEWVRRYRELETRG